MITYAETNGIATAPECPWAWTDEGENWFLDRGLRCVRNEIGEPGSILRWWWESGRVANLAWLFDRHAPTVAIGHSYGARLSILAANEAKVPPKELHLVSGAFICDSNRSGLNAYLRRDPNAVAYIYRGGSDAVLRGPARWSRILTLGVLGYGDGGYPQAVANYRIDPACSGRVVFRDVDRFGHSDFLSGAGYDAQSNLSMLLARIGGRADQPMMVFDREFTAAGGEI